MVNFFLYQYAYNWFANEICYIIIGCSGSVNWFPRVALLKFLSNAMLIAASTSFHVNGYFLHIYTMLIALLKFLSNAMLIAAAGTGKRQPLLSLSILFCLLIAYTEWTLLYICHELLTVTNKQCALFSEDTWFQHCTSTHISGALTPLAGYWTKTEPGL